MGEMADEQFFADPFDPYTQDMARSITCNRCGEDDLHWECDRGVYRLYDEDGDRHVCEPSTEGLTAL